MNRKPEPMPNPDLERLYRESGAAEPAAGLDRIVLARAEQALDHARRSDCEQDRQINRRPDRQAWLTGIATAAVALVALAVVLQQGPPTAPEAVHQPPRIDAAESPASKSAPAAPAAETGSPRESAGVERRAFAAPAAQARAARLEPAPAAPEAEPETSSDEVLLESFTVTGSRTVADRQALTEDEDSGHAVLFRQLRELIREGQLDQAHAVLQSAEERDGPIALPEDLQQSLGPTDGSD